MFGAYLLIALFLFRSSWRSPATAAIGDGGDLPLFLWYVRWTPFALTHAHNPFLTTFLNYPQGVNLMWNTPMYLATAVMTPVTAVLGEVVSYNVLMTAGPVLSAFTAQLAMRRYVDNSISAAVGGLMYGFSPFIVAHSLGHIVLVLAFIPPLVLLVLDEILIRQRRPWPVAGILLGVLLAAQLLISEEILAAIAVMAVLGTLVLIMLAPRQVISHARHAILALSAAAIVAACVASVPLAFQFLGPRQVRGQIWPDNLFVSDLLGFVIPTRLQWLSPSGISSLSSHFTGFLTEWDSYLGAPLIAVLAFTAVRIRRLLVARFLATMILIAAILSLGPHLHVMGRDTGYVLPEAALSRLPLLSNLLPARLGLFLQLFAATLLAVSLDSFLRWRRERLPLHPRRRFAAELAGLAGFLLALLPLLPTPSLASTSAQSPSFFYEGGVQRFSYGEVVLVAPFNRGTQDTDAMKWQAASNMRFRMPQGFFLGPDHTGKFIAGTEPYPLARAMISIGAGEGAPILTSELAATFRSDLTAHRVSAVVVGPCFHQDEMLGMFRSLLGRAPESVGGVYVWWSV